MSTACTTALALPEQLISQQDVTAVVTEVARLKRQMNEITADMDEAIKAAHKTHKTLTTKRAEACAPYEDAISLGERLLSEFATRIERLNTLVRAQAGADIRRERLEDPDIIEYIADIRETEGDVAADMFAAEIKHMDLPTNLPVYEEKIDYGPGQTRREYSVEVVDANAVPREYWKLDEAKIKKVASAGVNIPGVAVNVSLKRIVKAEV